MFDSTGCTFGLSLLFYIVPRSLLMISVAQRALLWIWIGTRELLLLICIGPRTLLLIYVSSMVLLLIWVDPRKSCMVCMSSRAALLLIYLSRALLYLGRTTCSFRKGESPAYTDTGALRGTNTVNALTKRTKYISIVVAGSICKESIFPYMFFCLQLSIAYIHNAGYLPSKLVAPSI